MTKKESADVKEAMTTEKKGNYWTAYHDTETGRYFARTIYISRKGYEEYRYEITQDIYARLGTFADDCESEKFIRSGKMAFSFNNTMYGTLGPERTVWDEEANEEMKKVSRKSEQNKKKKKK